MKIRSASHADGQFILEFIVKNARNHFNPVFESLRHQEGLVDQIKNTINNKSCPMPDKTYPSQLWVADENGVAVAFMWVLQRSNNESEIYLTGVASDHQKRGLAELLLNNFLEKLKPGNNVTSRVKRKSQKMKKLLQKMGFISGFYFPFCAQKFHKKIS